MTMLTNDDIITIIERVAKAQEEKKRRLPSREEYKLLWTRMVPYTDANIELVTQDGVGSCVYEIWHHTQVRRTAVYVGETQELGKRLTQHKGKAEENEGFKSADFSQLLFSYAPVSYLIARKSVERALWKLYRYAWNGENGPVGMGVDGTILLNEVFPEEYTINFNGIRKPLFGVNSPVDLP